MSTEAIIKSISKRVVVSLFIIFIMFTSHAQTGNPDGSKDKVSKGISCIVCKVAQLVFMLVAALATLIIILAGVRWLTSGDDPGARTAAKNTIISAFVGLIIIFMAVYLVSYVVGSVVDISGMDPAEWVTGCKCDQIKLTTTPTT